MSPATMSPVTAGWFSWPPGAAVWVLDGADGTEGQC